jgi:cytoskeleton protein RodZ
MFRSKVDTNSRDAEEAIGKIGAELRRLRTKRGERLEDVAQYLGIKATHLYGIEQGDLSIIPSKHDVRSFTSSYANYLGLDGDTIMKQLATVIRSLEGAKAPFGSWNFSGVDRFSAIILTSAVVLGVFAGWSYLGDVAKLDLIAPPLTAGNSESDDGEAIADAVIDDDVIVDPAEAIDARASADLADATDTFEERSKGLVSEAERALANLELQAAQAQKGTLQAPPPSQDLPASQDLRVTRSVASNEVADNHGERAAEGSARREELPANLLATLVAKRGDGAAIYEPENTDARVIVRALDTSWIQVSSRDRSYLWTRTMQPREMLLVPNRDDLELWAGDASGVEILLDGVVLPKLGPPGTVVRGVSLTPDSLAALSDMVSSAGSGKPTF